MCATSLLNCFINKLLRYSVMGDGVEWLLVDEDISRRGESTAKGFWDEGG